MNLILRAIAPAAALALLLSPTLVRTADAAPQLGQSAGFAEAFQPDFLSRDMDLIVETLELEDWQRTILQSLLDDYQNDFRIGVDGLKDKLKAKGEEIKASGSQDAMGIIMGPIGEWSREKVMLKQRFLDNLRGQLSESQAARWDALDRAMLRDKELPRGVLSGESLNLIAIAREVTLSPDAAEGSKAALEEYSVALDEALRARASQMAQSQPVIQQAMVAQDWRKGLAQVEAILARRIALRDLQDRSIETIAASLGTAGADFRERALRTAYPQAYRPSPLIAFFASARTISGVTPQQVAEIDAIEAEFVVAHADLENRWAAAMRMNEPKAQLLDVQMRAAAASGADFAKPDADPYRGLREERDRLSRKAHEDVARVLGPELAELLPGGGDKARAERAAAASKDGSQDRDGLGKSAGAKPRMKPEARDPGKESVEGPARRPATSPAASE